MAPFCDVQKLISLTNVVITEIVSGSEGTGRCERLTSVVNATFTQKKPANVAEHPLAVLMIGGGEERRFAFSKLV